MLLCGYGACGVRGGCCVHVGLGCGLWVCVGVWVMGMEFGCGLAMCGVSVGWQCVEVSVGGGVIGGVGVGGVGRGEVA